MKQTTNPHSDYLRILIHDDRRIYQAIRQMARAHTLLQSCIIQSPDVKELQSSTLKLIWHGCAISEYYTRIITGRVITDPARLLPCYLELPF